MSDVLSPRALATPTPIPRDAPISGIAGAQPARAKGAESAIAVRPVDPATQAQDLRLEARRDLPVGPAPTFKVNILQDLRDSLREPPQPKGGADADGAVPPDGVSGDGVHPGEAPAAEVAPHQALYRADHSPALRDHALNKTI